MHSETDVCFVLEGTYPYIAGGVSSWVHQMISSLPEFTFSLALIMPDKASTQSVKYKLPENLKEIQIIYLHEFDLPKNCQQKLQKDAWSGIEEFHKNCDISEQLIYLESMFRNYFNPETRGIPPDQLLDKKQSWNILTELYEERASKESFIDYFWTFRFTHFPIFKVLASELPKAALYHTVSTGYAGLLATIGKIKYRRPVILTEHGIYTRERRIEISRADWIYEKDTNQVKVRKSQSRFKEQWIKMFRTFSGFTYEYADLIITLFYGNQVYQREDGANPEKMLVIPNGMDIELFQSIRKHPKQDPEEFVIGFMGRVVSIKDVKTFIRVCKEVADVLPKVKVYIMGPTDEEQAYYEECLKLTDLLGLKEIIQFTGQVNIKEYYPKIDVIVLTSISESQPLVVLEANCIGIPVVATDVGSCRELLYGRNEEDMALGKSGLVVGVTNTKEIADAIITILKSKDLGEKMGEAGKKRVSRFYNKKDLDDKYRELYNHYKAM